MHAHNPLLLSAPRLVFVLLVIIAEVMDAEMRRVLTAGLPDMDEFTEDNLDSLLDDDFMLQAAGANDVSDMSGTGKGRHARGGEATSKLAIVPPT